MILVDPAGGPVPRLLRAVRARAASLVDSGPRTRILAPPADAAAPVPPPSDAERMLVVDWIGTHRDARVPALRAAWDLEERARATGLPVLVLRLAPLVGPSTPLMRALRAQRPTGRAARALVQPVREADVVETLVRALDGRAAWRGWYEVCGEEVLTLEELAALAASTPDVGAGEEAEWEPALDILAVQGLAEPDAWRGHFGITPGPLRSALAGSAT